MRERAPTILVVAAMLAAFLGLRSLPSDKQPSETKPPSASSQPPQSVKEKLAGKEFYWPLIDFHSSESEAKSLEGKGLERFLAVPDWDLQFLIVTLADPIDSSSGHEFDHMVDWIQRALETQDFVLTRYHYPWKAKEEGASKKPAEGDKDSAPEERRREYERQPGVLLFRAAPKRLLMVFLVGETATGGIHKEALTAALDLIALTKTETIPILGPMFSGSQVTLPMALSNWASRQAFLPQLQVLAGSVPVLQNWPKAKKFLPRFRVISGSATAIEPSRFVQACLPAKATFQATVIPEDIVFDEVIQSIDLIDKHLKIAVLCESNTVFGKKFISSVLYKPGPLSNAVMGLAGNGAGPESKSKRELVVFPFPMHISDVRLGYEKAGDGKGATSFMPTFGSRLKVPPEEGGARDIEPSLHPGMTAVLSERMLASIMTAIAHENFRYVVITASDVRDKIFLATLVRQQCPDVRLLFTSTEGLLSHPDFSPYLKGALVAGSYPLYAKNQQWSFPFSAKRRLYFASQNQQGYYNAALALMTDDGQYFLEYGPPFQKPDKESRPPIWINIIGQHGMQPLAAITSLTDYNRQRYEEYVFPIPAAIVAQTAAEAEADQQRPPWSFQPTYSSFWMAPFLLAGLFAGVVAAAYASLLRRLAGGKAEKPPEKQAGGLTALFWPRSMRALRWGQEGYSLLCLAATALLFVIIAWISLIPAFPGSTLPVAMNWWQWFMPIVTLAFIFLFPFLAGWRLVLWAQTNPGKRRIWLVVLAICLFGAVLLLQFGLVILVLLAAPAVGILTLIFLAGKTLARAPRKFSWPALAYCFKVMKSNWLLLLCAVLLAICGFYLYTHFPEEIADGFLYRLSPERAAYMQQKTLFYFDRATDLTNGVSPLIPEVFAFLGLLCWGLCQLKRLYLLDGYQVAPPFPVSTDTGFKGLRSSHYDLLRSLRMPQRAVWSGKALILWLALFFGFGRLAAHFVPTVEGSLYDSLLFFCLAVLTLFIAHTFLELLRSWKCLHHLLQDLARLPLAKALGRLPGRIRSRFGPFLSSERPGRQGHEEDRQRQRTLLLDEYQKSRADLQKMLNYSDQDMERLDKEFGLIKEADATPTPVDPLTRTSRACFGMLRTIWQKLSLGEEALAEPAPPAPKKENNDADKPEPTSAPPDAPSGGATRWQNLAEEFVSLELVGYLSQFFVQLRNLFFFLTVGPLLLLLAVSSYPIPSQQLWLLYSGLIIITVAVGVIRVFVKMEKDEVVSHISGTSPHQLSFLKGEFVWNLIAYALPLLGVLAATSTDLANMLHSWLDPIFKVLK